MAWFNLNDGFNTLKGQISNFASGVLTEGIIGETDSNKIEPVQDMFRSQQLEVTSNGVEEEETAWSWDVAQDSGGPDKEEVEFLKQKIKTLEIEKRDLVQSLEQLDLDCQQTTDKLITLKDELQDDYSNLKIQFSDLRKSNDFLQGSDAKNKKQLQKIQEENKKLLKIVEELKTNKNNQINLLKNQPQENVDSKFQEENVLKRFENLRSSHDEENVRQQEIIKSYEAKLKEVVENHKKLDEENRKLIFEKKNYEQLQNDFEEYKKKSQETHAAMVDPEDYHKLSAILQAYEEKVNENKNELFATREELTSLKKENEELKSNQENEKKLREENFQKQNQEEFELNLIKHLNENLKKFVDYEVSLEENETFHKMTETVIKLILDVKWKTETLEKELLELTQEKTKILTEKNHEIEKLLQNSEILSQEVITKSQALKHYETECGELIKNNDLLITELDSYKNSSGLQTISESNEDNILLLESQLENANKRIRDLELTINDLEAAKQDVNIEVQSELEYIKKQLNLTGIELSQNKKEYKELQEKYEAVSNENLRLKSERNELSNAMERIKNDYENTEYKYVEMNIDMETLREEVETHKKHSDDLSIFNKKLEMLNTNNKSKSEVLAKEVESLKEELMEEVDSKHLLENRARNLTEKLQNAKMSETSLKLQFDTLQKELVLVADAKESTQRNYRETIHEIREKYEKVCAELETHENLKLENVALRNKIDQVCSEQASNDPKLELNVSEEEIKETSNLNDSDEFKQLAVENSSLRTKLQLLTEENFKLNRAYTENIQKLNNLEANFNQLNASQNELIALIQIKHQENVQYHSEIQRLSQLLNNETEKNKKLLPNSEEHEKIADQNKFLREKCELLAQNLLQEQSNLQKVLADRAESISEREQTLTKELDRLKSHLLEVEDTYTKELLGVEEKNQEIQLKLNEVEQREKNSSTMYTSVNIRANQQVETLQNQLQLVTVQRDDLRQKVSDHEDEIGKQSAALTNLQLVLKQFQKDRETDIYRETDRIRKQIAVERRIQDDLRTEVVQLKSQLDESKQGLLAASRLTDQLENAKQQVNGLKEEVTNLQEKLLKTEEKNKVLTTQTDSKVDKMLIKNLVIGFVSANSSLTKDQSQILKIIATVLDFTKQDNEKVAKQNQSSWLNAILHPQNINSNTGTSQESLSQAFVRFLENESKPRELPNLLDTASLNSITESSSSSPRQTPILLSEVVLPTFTEFAQSRNSSSILKDVLKDNS